MARRFVAALLEIAGIAALAVAGFTVATGLGFLAVGIGLIMFGLATERAVRPAADRDAG